MFNNKMYSLSNREFMDIPSLCNNTQKLLLINTCKNDDILVRYI